MNNMLRETIANSELNNSGKYRHEVQLNTNDNSEYQVVVIRHHNWGVGETEVFNITKNSINEAKEIYNFYINQLKESV